MIGRILMMGGERQAIDNRKVIPIEFQNGALTQKDVKNEGWSQWLIENKGAKKVLPMLD
jgi:hypothetical protein